MLVELSIRNFAIIPSLTVSFREGLHVLTGETGAGKSIIIDALSLLMGGRASVDYIRQGESKAEIEGFFVLKEDHPLLTVLQELDIDMEEETLILRRDISNRGKSICRINGKLVTLAILREVGQTLVDIHGQHEHQSLLREENHLHLLDDYGKEQIELHKQEYKQLYKQYKQLSQTIKKLSEDEQHMAQRLDLLRFQHEEIAAAKLEPQEDVILSQEKRKRDYAQKLFEGVEESYQALYSDGRALESLATVMNHLDDLAQVDEELKPSAELVETIYYQLEDLSHGLSSYRDQIEFDPERSNEIETRLMEIDQLKRKYGQQVEDILEYAAKIEEELDTIENKDERIQELVDQRHEMLLDVMVEAKHLSTVRKQIAGKLVSQIKEELSGLYMDKTEIDVRISPSTSGEKIEHEGTIHHIREEGCDDIQIMIRPNPGEALKPLSKIASGGELSRFMLALKSVFSKIEPVTTLVFDEVDTGVSGRVAQAMAEKLYRIARSEQVLCITHQPQAAAMSDEHYRILKEITEDKTVTRVIPLANEEKRNELVRMMSGAEVTSATEKHAEELLQSAARVKMEINKHLQLKENYCKLFIWLH